MALGVDVAAVVLAFALTIIEMTEVVVLVVALGIEEGSQRPAAEGAVVGVAGVSAVAAVIGVGLQSLPRGPLLGGAGITLALFGFFLLRSTLRTYRKSRRPSAPSPATHPSVPFLGGLTIGAVEATEVVIVLVALSAGGNASSALLGAFLAAVVLITATALVHERVRRLKVPTLKLGATSALFAFSVFWTGEAAGFEWPGAGVSADLWLVPLFVVALGLVRASIYADERAESRTDAKS